MVNRLTEYRQCERERDRLSARFDAIYAAAKRGNRGFNATELVALENVEELTAKNARAFRAVKRAIDLDASERARKPRTPPPRKQSRKPSPELWAGAVHEAAHVVVARARGGRTDMVSLRAAGGGSASVTPDGPTRVAGRIGEELLGCQGAYPMAAAARDTARAHELARAEAAEASPYRVEARADALVKHWQH